MLSERASSSRALSPASIPSSTPWITVLLAIAAGALAAFQVGKVHIALASIRSSFTLSLFSASWILSALSFVGLFAAIPAGSFSARIGNKKAIVYGLFAVAAASAVGGFSPTLAWLLLSRLIEGIGFVMIVVAAPSLIAEVTRAKDLRIVLAGWSAYMPGGVAIISLIAPILLAHHTWRSVWWFNAVVLALAGVIIALVAQKGAHQGDQTRATKASPEEHDTWLEMKEILSARGPLLLAVIFAMYTMQHLSIMGFMPTLMHERFGLPETRIGVLMAIAMASNILGNLAAGVLLQRGVSRARIISWTAVFMACMSIGMFVLPLPFLAFYLCVFSFSCVGGLIPSAVMGAAPFHTPSPSLLGATNGLLVQGSNLGIVVGPPVLSLILTRLGWPWVPVMTISAAVIAIVLANNMRQSTFSNPNLAPKEALL